LLKLIVILTKTSHEIISTKNYDVIVHPEGKIYLDGGEDRKITLVLILRKRNARAWTVLVGTLEIMGTHCVLKKVEDSLTA
jgi:hypothetical protein